MMTFKLTAAGAKKLSNPRIKYDAMSIDLSTQKVSLLKDGTVVAVSTEMEFRENDTLIISDLKGVLEVTFDA